MCQLVHQGGNRNTCPLFKYALNILYTHYITHTSMLQFYQLSEMHVYSYTN